MKDVTTLLTEVQDKLVLAGKSFREIKEASGDGTAEAKLNRLKATFAKELRESSRIRRNNGSGPVIEADRNAGRIAAHAKKFKISEAEAAVMLGLKHSDGSATSELREAWRRYCPSLKPHELDALAARKVPVPRG